MINEPIAQYCVVLTGYCMRMSEWKDFWQNSGILSSVVIGIVGARKVIVELNRLREQRDREIIDREASSQLKRTEFFLDQHRRLFDNSDLYEVLCFLDADDKKLASPEMWDKKRKFLTFVEEIALLVKSGYIEPTVAYYMFGYYAQCAHAGRNFKVGINLSPQHWCLFYRFVENARRFDCHPRRSDHRYIKM
jgi:hypothetical protein